MRNAWCWSVPLVLFALVACGGHDASLEEGSDAAGRRDHDAAAQINHAAADHDTPGVVSGAESSHGLVLNGRAKWKMDVHTRMMFAKMVERLDGKSPDDAATTPDAWKQTGAALEEDIAELFAGCTMQGAAHDQLHQFLMLYIPAVDNLMTSGAAESATQVQELLEVYPAYFE